MSEREFPTCPRLGVGVVAVHGGQVLLVERNSDPLRGFWTFPGGVVELGESLREAAHREMLEETGLDVEILDVADVYERVDRDADGRIRFHYVVIDFLARLRNPDQGQPHAATDARQARWVACDHVTGLPITPGVERVLGRALRLLHPCGSIAPDAVGQ